MCEWGRGRGGAGDCGPDGGSTSLSALERDSGEEKGKGLPMSLRTRPVLLHRRALRHPSAAAALSLCHKRGLGAAGGMSKYGQLGASLCSVVQDRVHRHSTIVRREREEEPAAAAISAVTGECLDQRSCQAHSQDLASSPPPSGPVHARRRLGRKGRQRAHAVP